MIIYNPLDGRAIDYPLNYRPKHVFLMTKLGNPVPATINKIRESIETCCHDHNFQVIDAQTRVTGRDFLWKIWEEIAGTPISIGILHEDIPSHTQSNIFYEIGVAQALGKETLIVKSPGIQIPSDFIRTEYIEYTEDFSDKFARYLQSVMSQSEFYETVSDQLERNPILALDYLKRAFLINGDLTLKHKADLIINSSGFSDKATTSVEGLLVRFHQ